MLTSIVLVSPNERLTPFDLFKKTEAGVFAQLALLNIDTNVDEFEEYIEPPVDDRFFVSQFHKETEELRIRKAAEARAKIEEEITEKKRLDDARDRLEAERLEREKVKLERERAERLEREAERPRQRERLERDAAEERQRQRQRERERDDRAAAELRQRQRERDGRAAAEAAAAARARRRDNLQQVAPGPVQPAPEPQRGRTQRRQAEVLMDAIAENDAKQAELRRRVIRRERECKLSLSYRFRY